MRSPPTDLAPHASVVIASRDRPADLQQCLRILHEQVTDIPYEIVVVDDGSSPPLRAPQILADGSTPVQLLHRGGEGPARARNAGVARARGSIILFTDDDTLPSCKWIDIACRFLDAHPNHVGVEGPTVSPPYDRLYFHSVEASSPGSFFTCNIAYRRSAIEAVGGFADVFPFAHGEDLDLGFRISQLGPIGYEPTMVVVHPPRPSSLRAEIMRARGMASDGYLYRRHPSVYPPARYLSGSGYALVVNAKHWAYSVFRDQYNVGRSPRRALRFSSLAVGSVVVGSLALTRDACHRIRTRITDVVHRG